MAEIIGRERERRMLCQWYASTGAEFVVVYGRRRVGKTFLIREMFKEGMTFYHTALSPMEMGSKGQMARQLQNFHYSLRRYGYEGGICPRDWYEAFESLIHLLESKPRDKRMMVFIDEMPWMDTPRSGFVSALEHFWNGWGAGRDNLFLVVCGSATSWISHRLIGNKGGLYGRVTHELKLSPFTLMECEEYFKKRNIVMDRYSLMESYMILGGIPYYLSFFQPGMSLAQNIDQLCFRRDGNLTLEFERLYGSIFSSPELFIRVVKVLSQKREGLTRGEICEKTGLSTGGGLSNILAALEVSDFITSYYYYGRPRREIYYRVTDFYSLFYLRFIAGNKTNNPHYWEQNRATPAIAAWRGYTFELLCFTHIAQIKRALGISGIHSEVSPWRYVNNGGEGSKRGAQIDLIIDRADRVVSLCEMKCLTSELTIDKDLADDLRGKAEALRMTTKGRKGIQTVIVTTYGIRPGQYVEGVQGVVTIDALFAGV